MILFVINPPIFFVYSIYLYLIRTFNLNPHIHKVIKTEMDRLQSNS